MDFYEKCEQGLRFKHKAREQRYNQGKSLWPQSKSCEFPRPIPQLFVWVLETHNKYKRQSLSYPDGKRSFFISLIKQFT